MKVKLEVVSVDSEVILFNDEKEKVIVLSKAEKQLVFSGKQVIPICPTGRLINFNMQYKGEYYKSFVVGGDKRITAIGHVVDCDVAEDVLSAIENDGIIYIEEELKEESNILILFIE